MALAVLERPKYYEEVRFNARIHFDAAIEDLNKRVGEALAPYQSSKNFSSEVIRKQIEQFKKEIDALGKEIKDNRRLVPTEKDAYAEELKGIREDLERVGGENESGRMDVGKKGWRELVGLKRKEG